MSEDFDDFLDKKVSLKQLIKELDFTEEAVERAAMRQPTLFLEACRFRVQKMRDRVQRHLAYDGLITKVGSRYREKKDKQGKKPTEGAIKEQIQRYPEVRDLRKKMEYAFVVEKFSEGLMEAYKQRLTVIRIIIDARWSEAGTAVKAFKEEGARKMAKRLQKDVRERYKKVKSGDDSDSDD